MFEKTKIFLKKFPAIVRIVVFCKEALLRPIYSIRWWRPVWYYLINREGKNLFLNHPPELNPAERRVAEDLKRYGIAVVHIDELFPEKNLFSELERLARELRLNAKASERKKFLLDLWESNTMLDLHHPYVRFSLAEPVLKIISEYMGVFPKFYYYLLNAALPAEKEQKPVQSQRWHRDPEDKIMCKVFLYLTDVDTGSGPFTYIKGSHYGGKWRHLFSQKPPHGNYPPEGALEKIIPSRDIFVATAKAGTMIFCDTSGLHRGGYAKENERIMFTAGFISKASQWRPQYKIPDDLDRQASSASLLLRYALKPWN